LDEKENKGKGKKSQSKAESGQGARRNTCPKSSVFTVMKWDTVPQNVNTRRQARIPQEEWRVKPWLDISNLILPSLYEWQAQ